MTQTEIALSQLARDIKDARQDIALNDGGNSTDMILPAVQRDLRRIRNEQLPFDLKESFEKGKDAGRSQVEDREDDNERLHRTMEARTTIGTFFDDLRAIYEPKEGSGPTHG